MWVKKQNCQRIPRCDLIYIEFRNMQYNAKYCLHMHTYGVYVQNTHGNDEHQLQAHGYFWGKREKRIADWFMKASTVSIILYFNLLERSKASWQNVKISQAEWQVHGCLPSYFIQFFLVFELSPSFENYVEHSYRRVQSMGSQGLFCHPKHALSSPYTAVFLV